MKKKFIWGLLVAGGLSLSPLSGVYAQCSGCTVTDPTGNVDFSGNTVVCLTANSNVSLGNINGTGNVICVSPGTTWDFSGGNIGVNGKALTIEVYGTLNLSNSAQTTVGAAIINVYSGGSIVSPPDARVVFQNTEVNNHGNINVGHLENSHTNKFTNFSDGNVSVNGVWYQHGAIFNQGTIETQCGVTTPQFGYQACEFIVGDKNVDDFQNEGVIKITGPGTIGGQVNTSCDSKISFTDHVTVTKPIVGGGSIVGTTGSFSNDGNLTGGTGTCTPEVYFTGGPGGDFNNSPQNGTPNYNVNAALPVVLISLSAKVEANGVVLNWATSSEENSSYFSVERSTDLKGWTEIGQVNAAGESADMKSYSFTDEKLPGNGIWYYRLKIVDADGTYKHSNARSALVGFAVAPAVVYPNPAFGTLFIKEISELKLDRVFIYDKGGKVVKAVQSFDFNGIDVSDLKPGAYIVRLIYKNGSMQVHNVVINK